MGGSIILGGFAGDRISVCFLFYKLEVSIEKLAVTAVADTIAVAGTVWPATVDESLCNVLVGQLWWWSSMCFKSSSPR